MQEPENDAECHLKEKELELESKSMDIGQGIFSSLFDGCPYWVKFSVFVISTLGFVGVCAAALFGNYGEEKSFWLLIALLPFTLFIPEKKLLHDLIEAMISLLVSIVKAPQKIGSGISTVASKLVNKK